MTHDEEVQEHKMRDTFGGYDWGDPIRPWFRPRPVGRPKKLAFTLEQLAIADRALETRQR